jgi:hypothetical protein
MKVSSRHAALQLPLQQFVVLLTWSHANCAAVTGKLSAVRLIGVVACSTMLASISSFPNTACGPLLTHRSMCLEQAKLLL